MTDWLNDTRDHGLVFFLCRGEQEPVSVASSGDGEGGKEAREDEETGIGRRKWEVGEEEEEEI